MHAPKPAPMFHLKQAPLVKQQARPRAATPVSLQIGDTVSINGQLFVISPASPGLAPVGALPVPPPPPPPPLHLVLGYRNSNRDPVTQIHAGEFLILDGGSAAAAAYLAPATRVLFGTSGLGTNIQPNATGISCTVPDLGLSGMFVTTEIDGPSGPLVLGPTLQVLPPLLPGPGPIPTPAALAPYTNWIVDATGGRLSAAHPGQVVTVQGHGFGIARGTVQVCHEPASVQAWTDTAIVIVVPSLTAGPCALLIRRPDGAYYESFAFQVAP